MSSPFSDLDDRGDPPPARRKRPVSARTVLLANALIVLAVAGGIGAVWWSFQKPSSDLWDHMQATLASADRLVLGASDLVAKKSPTLGELLRAQTDCEIAAERYEDALRTLARYEQAAGASEKTAGLDSMIRVNARNALRLADLARRHQSVVGFEP